MQDEVHPGLIKMINKMLEEATSSDNESDYINTRLKNDIIEQIKEHNLDKMYYSKFLEKMNANNATVRNLTFQLVADLVLQSPEVRHLFIYDLHNFIDYIYGTHQTLPPPETSIKDLRNRFSELIEILDNQYRSIYPHFSICREYIKGQQILERKNQKRMAVETIHYQEPPKKKKHSMAILQESVNTIIWELFDEMEVFEYEDTFEVEFDVPSFNFSTSTSIGTEDNFFSLLSVDEKAVKEKQSKQEDLMLEKKEIFEKMKENNEKLVNEYIPTLERNEVLLKSRNTQKARVSLEKIKDMLDRCRQTSKRCTRIIYRYKEKYGNESVQ